MTQLSKEILDKLAEQKRAQNGVSKTPTKPSTPKDSCPTCGARFERERMMHRFDYSITDFLRQNRVAKLDSCILCVEKHVSRAMIYFDELLTAKGSGTSTGTASVNIPMNHLKILGHLGCAIEESEDYTELNTYLIDAERDYRYEGISPDWSTISSLISDVKNAQK